MMFNKYKLHEVATIDFSGIDKKSKTGETPVRLCNFVDVYYNWAITKTWCPGLWLRQQRITKSRNYGSKKVR